MKETQQILLPILADFLGRTPAIIAGCSPGQLVCPSSHPRGLGLKGGEIRRQGVPGLTAFFSQSQSQTRPVIQQLGLS